MKIETSKQTEIKRKILIQIKFYILSFIGSSFDRKNSDLAKLFFFWIYNIHGMNYSKYIDRRLLKSPLLEMFHFLKYALWKISLFFFSFLGLNLKSYRYAKIFLPSFYIYLWKLKKRPKYDKLDPDLKCWYRDKR